MVIAPTRRTYRSYGLTGSLSARISQGLEQNAFTSTDRRIAKVIAANWQQSAYGAAAVLAEQAGCDKASVSRFIKRLGYNSHDEFKLSAQALLAQQIDLDAFDNAGVDDDETSWVMEQFLDLASESTAHIQTFGNEDREEFEDQVRFIASRISRAKCIYVVAATTGAVPLLPVIEGIFSSLMTIPVGEISTGKVLKAHVGNHLIVLHAPSFTQDTTAEDCASTLLQPADECVFSAHLVVGSEAPAKTNARRVLHLHDGTDRIAALSMLTNTCMIMVREAIMLNRSRART